jgi:DNA-binding GntR family transcriptional regulator
LREDILGGLLPPGERLVEASVAARFGVSRVPVREALSQLQSEGFISLVRYRGATVLGTSRTEVLELMQVRRGLEVLSAQLAAENRGGLVADDLARVVDRGREAGRLHDLDKVPSLVVEFHSLVAAAAGNSQLQQMLEHVLRRVSWVFDRHLDTRANDEWSDHGAIAKAILGGSPVQAGYLMAEHIAKDEALLKTLTHP